LDEKNVTQAQKKCLHLDWQATNIFLSIYEWQDIWEDHVHEDRPW
jgi:hypothetical protein